MQIRCAKIEDSAGVARVQVDSYKTAYAGIFPQVYLDRFTYEEEEQDWRTLIPSDTEDILYVVDSGDGKILGYALGRPGIDEIYPYDCELVALHVLKDHQRQGIGSQLFAAVARHLQQAGCQSLLLWTTQKNPIRSFYEKIDGQFLQQKDWSGNSYYAVDVKEVAYGWLDIKRLCKSLELRLQP